MCSTSLKGSQNRAKHCRDITPERLLKWVRGEGWEQSKISKDAVCPGETGPASEVRPLYAWKAKMEDTLLVSSLLWCSSSHSSIFNTAVREKQHQIFKTPASVFLRARRTHLWSFGPRPAPSCLLPPQSRPTSPWKPPKSHQASLVPYSEYCGVLWELLLKHKSVSLPDCKFLTIRGLGHLQST
jgi:hypothetical protein